MSWRGHAWEFAVTALSWIVAIGAIAFVAAFVACDALRRRRCARRKGSAS